VHYIEGNSNVVADCLSRSIDIIVLFEEMNPLDWRAMIER